VRKLDRGFRGLLIACALLLSTGCASVMTVPGPLRTIPYDGGVRDGRTLVVFLPGRGGHAEDFGDAGFPRIARELGMPIDMIAVDARTEYYYSGTLVKRLDEDVIGPARARGYRRIWLVGISMGGLGALLYAGDHADSISGVLLLAPYLGEAGVLGEIRAAGGLEGWTPPETAGGGNYTTAVWSWLKRTLGPERPAAPLVPIYLGYGSSDRLASSHRLLQQSLPEDHVFTTRGGHRWGPWRDLWRQFLEARVMDDSGPAR